MVDDRAVLADDVVVGPGCVIEGAVTLGAGCRLIGHVFLQGPMTLGERNIMYPNVCLGYAPQDVKIDPATFVGAGTVIGDRNFFREGVTIHRATGKRPTTVGNDNYFMCNSHLGHDVILGNNCQLANGSLIAGHVEVQDNVILGGNSGVHQFCRVGRLSMISGIEAITKDLPPFCVSYNSHTVGSLNLVGLRRGDLRPHIDDLRRAFDIMYRSGLANDSAVARIRGELGHDTLCMEFADFIASTKRGICPYVRHVELHEKSPTI